MNKTVGIILGVVVVILIGVFIYMNVFNKPAATTNNNNNTTTDNNNTGTDTTPVENTVNTNAVSIKDEAFTPAAITVKVGTKATWTNNDPFTHTVAFDNTSIQSSGNIDAGQTFSVTFTKAGTYNYHCSIHAFMTGSVVVQ